MVKETNRYLINEAAKEVHVESHVLRYWEEELELPINRNEQGHRIYTQEDIERFKKIKRLKDQGLQLKAVRTFLEQIPIVEEGGYDMRSDNPFAQKQLTKIGKNGDMKVIQIKSADDSKWRENTNKRRLIEIKEKKNDIHKNHISDICKEERHVNNLNDEDYDGKDKHVLAIQIKEMDDLIENEENNDMVEVADNTNEQTARLQYLFQKLIKEVMVETNKDMEKRMVKEITTNVKTDICKELDYQFRLIEEREEQWRENKQEMDEIRNEEYYKRIDELLRKYTSKKDKQLKDSRVSFLISRKSEKKKNEKVTNIDTRLNAKKKDEKKGLNLFKKTVDIKK